MRVGWQEGPDGGLQFVAKPIRVAVDDGTRSDCPRIGGCLHDIGQTVCCCDDGSCDGMYPEPTETLDVAALQAEVERWKQEAERQSDSRIYDKSAMSWMLQLCREPRVWEVLTPSDRQKVLKVKHEYEKETTDMLRRMDG